MVSSDSTQLTQKKQNFSGMIITAILVVLLVGSVYISQLIFQEIAKSFNIDLLQARLVFSLSCFFYALSFFIYGPLSDRVSTRVLVLFGCMGTVCCLMISGNVNSFNSYLFVMAMVGFFAASVPSALFAYTAKNTANEKLPQAMGIMISASTVGIIFSRSLIAMLTDICSWQIAFMIYAGFICCACIFIPMGIKRTIKNTTDISIAGTYLAAAKLLLNKTVVLFLLIGFLLFAVYLGLTSFLTFYLKGAPFYLSSTVLGWLNFAGISAVIGATITGKLAQLVPQKYLLIFCLFCVAVAIAIIGYSSHLLFIFIGIFLLFLFVFGIQPIVISILNRIVAVHSRGAISSLYLLSCLAGGSIGTYILGNVYERFNWNGLIIVCVSLILLNIILVVVGMRLVKKAITNYR